LLIIPTLRLVNPGAHPLCLLQPVRHTHRVVHRRRGGEVLRLLAPARALV